MGKLLHKRILDFYKPTPEVVVIDKDDRLAIDSGNINDFHLVIISTPIGQISSTFKKIVEINPEHTYVCEIGSAKEEVYEQCIQAMSSPSDNIHLFFESVHPMVGPLATDWNVFEWNKKCLIVRKDIERRPETQRIEQFWKDIGFSTHLMSLEQHDDVIGRLSHLSHFMIMEYVNFVKKTLPPELLKFGGPSFETFSKMAEGAARLEDIYKANAELKGIVAAFSKHLRASLEKIQED
jgi:prephenate dehydrogenase